MNEQIRELLKQADLQPYYDAQAGQIEKFAELIVRECAHLVGGYTKENEFGTDVKEAYEEITKHFGVGAGGEEVRRGTMMNKRIQELFDNSPSKFGMGYLGGHFGNEVSYKVSYAVPIWCIVVILIPTIMMFISK